MPQSATESSGSSGAIRPIDSRSVHRITSGQVVVDLQTATKELVENALDASATNIGLYLVVAPPRTPDKRMPLGRYRSSLQRLRPEDN
jgi:hypothetical protein